MGVQKQRSASGCSKEPMQEIKDTQKYNIQDLI